MNTSNHSCARDGPRPTWSGATRWRATIFLGVAVMAGAISWQGSQPPPTPWIRQLLLLAAGGVIVLLGLELRRRSPAPPRPSPVTVVLIGGMTLLHLCLAIPFDADYDGRGSALIVRLTGCDGQNPVDGPVWLHVTELAGIVFVPVGIILLITSVVQRYRTHAPRVGRPALIVGAMMVLAGFVTCLLIFQEAITTSCG